MGHLKRALFGLSSLTLLISLAAPAAAQRTAASLTGRVTDESGAAVPGAAVAVTNAETNVAVWRGVTDAAGNYLAPSLPVGTYDITVELQGFKTVTVKGVPLAVAQRARVDATLATGGIQETVTVVGGTLGQLETEDSSMGLVIDPSQVQGMPLPNRNVLNLVALAGGVSTTTGDAGLVNSAQMSFNGSRTLNSEFSVDGVSVLTGSTGNVNRLPSTEAIREFKVQTSSYSAEYGRTAGGFVNLVINSGTDKFHGGVYEYFRNEHLNANTFFNKVKYDALSESVKQRCQDEPDNIQLNATCGRRPQNRQHQFGFKIGGPIVKGKTFFFLNYEGVRTDQTVAPLSNIPDSAWRNGDFSSFPGQIINPDTGLAFAGNQIPSDLIDPAARKIMGLLPAPNAPGTADAANGRLINNFQNTQTITTPNNEVTLRLDHHVSTKARLNGRFTYYFQDNPTQVQIPGPLDPAGGGSKNKGYQATFGWTHVWSPAVLSEVSFGFMHNQPDIDPPSLGIDIASTYGIQRSIVFNGYGGGPETASPQFRITGWGVNNLLGMNDNTYRRQIDNNYQAAASLSWVSGQHNVKVGSQIRFNEFNVFNPGAEFTGRYNFTGEITSPTKTGGNPAQALADFLLGRVKTASFDLPQPKTGRRNYNLAFFVQDDWKPTARLTINAGLRYEYESPMWMNNDVYSRLDIRSGSVGKLLVAGNNASRTLDLEGDKMNFAPRLGLAYMIDDKTVFRAGGGIFYGQIFSNLGGVVAYPGFTARQDFSNLGAGVAQSFRLYQGHPQDVVQNLEDPFYVERNATPSRPLTVQSDGNNQFGSIGPLPMTILWNAGIQRELPFGIIADLSYVGSRGKHLPVLRNQNTVPYDQLESVAQAGTALAAQQVRPNPNVTSFAAFVHEGDSWYNSGQLRLTRRFSERLAFQTSYTFAKSIDTGSGIFNFSQANGLDVGDLAGAVDAAVNRGLSSLDRPHTLVAAVQYETGGPKWVRGIQANMMLTYRSGLVDTIVQDVQSDWNTIPSLPGASRLQQRPNVKPGSSTDVRLPQTAPEGAAIRYLMPVNDASFPFTPSGPYYTGSGASRKQVIAFSGPGTLGRSTVRGPSEFNIDASLARRFAIAHGVGVTLRAEAFNLLNHVNLNNPNTTLNVTADAAGGWRFNSPSFGLITTAKNPRFMQLVARIDF